MGLGRREELGYIEMCGECDGSGMMVSEMTHRDNACNDSKQK